MSLLDKIIELRAKSVTPEEFKETWGITKEEYRQAMSDFIDEQYAKAMAREDKAEVETAVLRAAAAAKVRVAGRKVAVKKAALKTGSGKTFPTVVLGLDDGKAASCGSVTRVFTPKGVKIKKGGKGTISLAALKDAKVKLVDVAGNATVIVPERTAGLIGELPAAMVKGEKVIKGTKGLKKGKGGPSGLKK